VNIYIYVFVRSIENCLSKVGCFPIGSLEAKQEEKDEEQTLVKNCVHLHGQKRPTERKILSRWSAGGQEPP